VPERDCASPLGSLLISARCMKLESALAWYRTGPMSRWTVGERSRSCHFPAGLPGLLCALHIHPSGAG